MKQNTQEVIQIDATKPLQTRLHCRKRIMHQISLRIMIVVLLLMAIAGFEAIVLVHHAEARSACGIIFVCWTPTPIPVSTPNPTPVPAPASTPISNPTPAPIATPTPSLKPSPTVASLPAGAPTVTISTSPTAIAAAASAPIKRSPAPIPVTQNHKTRRQSSDSGFSLIWVIIATIFLCLLLTIIIGWLVLRRILLPPTKVKRSADGVSSGTRKIPNATPSTQGFSNTKERQRTEITVPARDTIANDTNTLLSGFEPWTQILLADNTTTVATNAITVPDHPAQNAHTSPWYTVSDE